MTELTPERLAELKALEKAATEWHSTNTFKAIPMYSSRQDFEYDVALRNAAPALIAAAEERDELRKRAETAEKQEELWREDASKQLGELAQANLALVSARALLVRAGEAMGRVANEVFACTGMTGADRELRSILGNTNYNCLTERAQEARSLAAEIRRATQGETP